MTMFERIPFTLLTDGACNNRSYRQRVLPRIGEKFVDGTHHFKVVDVLHFATDIVVVKAVTLEHKVT